MYKLIFQLSKYTSTRKFYHTILEKIDEKFPASPEQIVISKYLKQGKKIVKQNKKTNSKNLQSQKTKRKIADYKLFITNNPYGSIIQRQHKSLTLNLASISNQRIKLSNIYELCQKFQPDLIFMQAKPTYYCPHFQLLPKQNGVFSDHKYLEQLIVKPNTIDSILNEGVKKTLTSILTKVDQKDTTQKVYIENTYGIVDDSITLMAAYYASKKQKQIVFGQMPDQPYTEWICNSHTLMELQQLFNNICKNIPFYSGLKLTPYQLGLIIYPEIFLNIKDRYMSTLFEMIVSKNKHKRVLGIFGIMQNQAVDQILQEQMNLRTRQDGKLEHIPVLEYLIPPEIKSSMFRNIEGWQIIEKHILMDIIYHGEDAVSINLDRLQTTNKVISYYGKNIFSYENQNLMRFRYDKTLKYISIMKQKIKQGQEMKKKILMRQAIRSTVDLNQ